MSLAQRRGYMGFTMNDDSLARLIQRYCPDPAPYSAMPAPDWLDELDLKPAPPHVRMGTHALDLEHWFVFDDHREREIALRKRLLTEERTRVFACLASAVDAAAETLELVTSWLRGRGMEPLSTDDEPLAVAGSMVQDDLCIMVHRDGDWHLDAAMLCFPAVWSLEEKLGRPTAVVHAPVRHYASELSGKVDRFFDRLAVDKPVWRRNFSIKATNALFLPYAKSFPPVVSSGPASDGSPFWIRSERQTLRRLPESGAILFTIRTQLAPLGVLAQRPDLAGALVAMYRSWRTDAGGSLVAERAGSNELTEWLEALAPSSIAG